jgi:hypothetical protein
MGLGPSLIALMLSSSALAAETRSLAPGAMPAPAAIGSHREANFTYDRVKN